MSYIHRAVALVILVLVPCGAASADAPPGVLVLRSGHVLRGGITHLGDRYLVTLGDRDEVSVHADRVEFHCATLDEAYERKRELIKGTRAAPHLELGDWCLQYGLLSRAAEQLLEAMAREPSHPQLARFETRLRLAARQASPAAEKAAPPVEADPGELPREQLELLVEQLPAGTVEKFTNEVQPILLNRCSSGGCHGPNTVSTFRLVRTNWGRAQPRIFTHRNLHATLAMVDRSDPDRSPLVQMLLAPHGNSDETLFSSRDAENWEQLVTWVRDLSSSDVAGQPQALSRPNAILLKPHENAGAMAPGGFESFPMSDPAPPDEVPAASDEVPPPRDPFDPEIFNRRFLNRKS